jgi:SecD/SecF fusion protein
MIFLYILLRFRQWQYSLGAVVALVHDVLMVISLYAIGGLFGLNLEIDQVFIAAILTVIGYSINDTVVVFDRIREVFADHKTDDVKVAINEAINETLSRTVITALTTFIVVLILLIFGGEVLRGFSYALTIGVLFGTYSSIFIASPIVLDLGVKTALNTAEWKPADEISEEWVEEKEVIEPLLDDKANKDKSGEKRTGSKFF